MTAGSADEFYSLMGALTQETMEGRIFNADLLIKVRHCVLLCALYIVFHLHQIQQLHCGILKVHEACTIF